MPLLQILKIRTKIIAVIALMGVIALAGLAYVSAQFKNADTRYSSFIAHESMAAMLNARATGGLLQMGFQLGLMLVNDPASPEFAAAVAKYEGDRALMKQRLVTTADLVSTRAQPVQDMLAAIDGFDTLGTRVIDLAKAGKTAEAAEAMKPAGQSLMAALPLFAGGNDQLIKMMDDGTAELRAQTNSTITTGLAGLGIALAAVILLGLFVSSRGITNRHRGRS